MSSGIYVAMAGAVAQSDALDVVSNNISNAGTTAFRAEKLRFTQVLSRAKGKDQAYVHATGGAEDATAGALTKTDNPLDVALQGDGFFGVQTERGIRYTRAGSFHVDTQHRLVTTDGLPLRSDKGKPLIVPADAAAPTISSDGVVHAGESEIGKLEIVRFQPGALKREGATLYAATAAPLVGTKAEVMGGALEQGNFNVVRGVVDLVRVSRTYEALHRMLESYKEMDDRVARGTGT